MKLFSHRLKKLRNEKKLRQEDLARAIQVSQRTISSWENGVVEPSIIYLKKIANFFCVSVDYIVGNDTETHKAFAFHRHEQAEIAWASTDNERKARFSANLLNHYSLQNMKDQNLKNFLEAIEKADLKEVKPFENIEAWVELKKSENNSHLPDEIISKIYDINPPYNDGYTVLLRVPKK